MTGSGGSLALGLVFVVLASCGGQIEAPADGGGSNGGSATSGGRGTAGGAGGVAGSAGAAGAACAGLSAAYEAALAEARSCEPMLSSLQCQTVVDDDLDCPCPEVVNERNSAAIAELTSLEARYSQSGCRGPACEVLCLGVQPVTRSGGCSPSGVCLSSASP
jgi:hypothetical protein